MISLSRLARRLSPSDQYCHLPYLSLNGPPRLHNMNRNSTCQPMKIRFTFCALLNPFRLFFTVIDKSHSIEAHKSNFHSFSRIICSRILKCFSDCLWCGSILAMQVSVYKIISFYQNKHDLERIMKTCSWLLKPYLLFRHL